MRRNLKFGNMAAFDQLASEQVSDPGVAPSAFYHGIRAVGPPEACPLAVGTQGGGHW